MRPLGWLMNLFQKKPHPRGDGPSFGPFVFAGATAGSNLTGAWTDSRIEQVRHFKHWVYVAVSRIAEKVAQMQPQVSVVRDLGPDRGPGMAGANFAGRHKALTQLQEREQLEPVPHDHRMVRLLRNPNPYDTAFDLWYETSMYLDLTGSAYWWTPLDALGLPTEIWVLPSHWMWPIIGKNRLIDGYQMRPIEGRHYSYEFPADEVIHFKTKSPISKIDGYAPQTAGSQWIDSSEAVDRSVWHSYRNGVLPQLQIELDANVTDPDDAVLERIHARIQQRYAGAMNTSRPLVLPPGFKAKPLNIKASEMLFADSADRLRDNILALFGVPAIVAGLVQDMTYGAILAAQTGFCSFRINPRLVYLSQVITEKLAWDFDTKLRVWWLDATPEDPSARERELMTDIKAGAITKNELRAIRGRSPWPAAIGDVPASEVDSRHHEEGSGNRNPTYDSEGAAEEDRRGSRNE